MIRLKSIERRRRFFFRGFSMEKRLPFLICVLLLCCILAFSWISYLGVRKATLAVGSERLHTLTKQLSTMFQQSTQNMATATRNTANHETVKKYLRSGGKESGTEALQLIQALNKDTQSASIKILDRNRILLLNLTKGDIDLKIDIDSLLFRLDASNDTSLVGKIYLQKDTVYYPVIAKTFDKNQIIGYIVRWRRMSSNAKAVSQLSQLLGSQARLYFGNADGTLWTDMIHPVAKSVIKKQEGRDFLYTPVKEKGIMAAVEAVPNAPWLIMIEFSQQTILEAAHRVLYWIIGIGVLLLITGSFVAWIISRNITSPLKKLTKATQAIAAGNYSEVFDLNRYDELGKLARAFNMMAAEVYNSQHNLEKKVLERTAQLETANKELEAFSYSVSHDLRAPLRAINGYSVMLKEDYEPKLDAEASRIINLIISNANMMGQLIDDLIAFSRMGRKEATHHSIDMKILAEKSLKELMENENEQRCKVRMDILPRCHGDQSMLKQVWVNLLSNAIKYSSKETEPHIEIGAKEDQDKLIYFVRDNGVGFDMQYVHKLFCVFQRLHSHHEFEGTGVGLALVKRIINKHNGEVWAESSPGKGAAFYFSLPKNGIYE